MRAESCVSPVSDPTDTSGLPAHDSEVAQGQALTLIDRSGQLPLSRRQGEVLAFIKNRIAETGSPPTYTEIANGLGVKSRSQVGGHVMVLERKGYLLRKKNANADVELWTKRGDGGANLRCCRCGETKPEREFHRDIQRTSGRRRNCIACTFPGARRHHGMWKTPEHCAWSAMITRCTNPNEANYHNYGGRGITVCTRWRESFVDFFADMGPRPSSGHSLDRIDVNGNYEPGNCRWTTIDVQIANKRVPPEFPGIGEMVKRLGLRPATVRKYLRQGLTEAEIPAFVGRCRCSLCGSLGHYAKTCTNRPTSES